MARFLELSFSSGYQPERNPLIQCFKFCKFKRKSNEQGWPKTNWKASQWAIVANKTKVTSMNFLLIPDSHKFRQDLHEQNPAMIIGKSK